ncbi:lipid-binding SYLF domain-containing protein [Telluria beijingensis]|uniref:lipid-binding SYLF domain-containing protein n=1 Tax=Telluria beijingensis TaxID=3068633 RepID=UPI002795481D|nr:lipid-binding SYLF domain-containing protein [Massilia sp. REN29]
MRNQARVVCVAVCLSVVAMAFPRPGALAQATANAAASQPGRSTPANRHAAAARKRVAEAAAVVARMEEVPRLRQLLRQAKGVFIVPHYGRSALGLGVEGGSGVLLARRQDNSWSDPAFFYLGSISLGAQAGAQGGPVAIVLNNDAVLAKFFQNTDFSLNGDTGLKVLNWAGFIEGKAGAGDVVVWSGTESLFGNAAAISVNGIRYSQTATTAYYDRIVTAQDVMAGKFSNAQADPLKLALANASR